MPMIRPEMRPTMGPVTDMRTVGEMPPGIREQIIHSMVEKSRQTAGSMMQAKHPELIMQGIADRQDKIAGNKKTKLTE